MTNKIWNEQMAGAYNAQADQSVAVKPVNRLSIAGELRARADEFEGRARQLRALADLLPAKVDELSPDAAAALRELL